MQNYSTFSQKVFPPLCPSHGERRLQRPAMLWAHKPLAAAQRQCHSAHTTAYVLSYLMLACSFDSAPAICCWVMLIFVSWLPGVNSIANNLFSCCLMQSQQKSQHLISHCSRLLFWGAIWVKQLTSRSPDFLEALWIHWGKGRCRGRGSMGKEEYWNNTYITALYLLRAAKSIMSWTDPPYDRPLYFIQSSLLLARLCFVKAYLPILTPESVNSHGILFKWLATLSEW